MYMNNKNKTENIVDVVFFFTIIVSEYHLSCINTDNKCVNYKTNLTNHSGRIGLQLQKICSSNTNCLKKRCLCKTRTTKKK